MRIEGKLGRSTDIEERWSVFADALGDVERELTSGDALDVRVVDERVRDRWIIGRVEYSHKRQTYYFTEAVWIDGQLVECPSLAQLEDYRVRS